MAYSTFGSENAHAELTTNLWNIWTLSTRVKNNFFVEYSAHAELPTHERSLHIRSCVRARGVCIQFSADSYSLYGLEIFFVFIWNSIRIAEYWDTFYEQYENYELLPS